jgi:hypothetical protein
VAIALALEKKMPVWYGNQVSLHVHHRSTPPINLDPHVSRSMNSSTGIQEPLFECWKSAAFVTQVLMLQLILFHES